MDSGTLNGLDSLKIDQLKQELFSQLKKELNKMKQEIIEGMCIVQLYHI